MNKTKVFRGKAPFSSYNTFEEMIERFMGDDIDLPFLISDDDFFNYLSDLIDYSLADANATIIGVSVPRNTMRGYMQTLQAYINADRTVYCLCANDISTAFYNREAFVTPYLMGNFYHTEDQSYVQVTGIDNGRLVCSDGIYRYAFGVDIGRPIVPSLGCLSGKALQRTFTFTDRIKQDNGMYAELMQDYQTTCDSLATAHEDIRTASNRNNELSHAIDALKVQLEDKDKTIARLGEAYTSEKYYASELDINLTQCRETIKNQKAIIEQYQNSEANYDEIIKKQKEAIDHYQNAVKKYAEHVNALESDLSMSKDEANCHRMKTDALLEEVSKLREENYQHKNASVVSEFRIHLTKAEDSIKIMRLKEELENTKQALNSEIAKSQKSGVNSLKPSLEGLVGFYKAWRASMDGLDCGCETCLNENISIFFEELPKLLMDEIQKQAQ